MANASKTVIVTGGSQGIGSGAVQAFLTGTTMLLQLRAMLPSRKTCLRRRSWLWWMAILRKPLLPQEWRKQLSAHSARFDALINNAGIFFTKPFTDYTAEDFKRLFSTNLDGFIYVTQLAIKQMLAQKSGGSIVSIPASLADNPIAGVMPQSR